MNEADDPNAVLDRLGAHSSSDPELVSVYVPPDHLIDEAIVFLDDEHTEAEGTDDPTLVRLQDRLAEYDRPPENGMALFCGRVNGEWVEATLESPPAPVEGFQYRRDETFLIGAFRDLLDG